MWHTHAHTVHTSSKSAPWPPTCSSPNSVKKWKNKDASLTLRARGWLLALPLMRETQAPGCATSLPFTFTSSMVSSCPRNSE